MKRDLVQIGAKPAALEAPAMAGGAGGEPAESTHRAMRIAGIDDVAPMREHPQAAVVPTRRYRYIGTTGKVDGFGGALVMYNGQSTRVHVGKVYTENQVDLDWLRKQGLQFEEIDELGEALKPREELQAGAAE